jgi:signal transduction histidine kinase
MTVQPEARPKILVVDDDPKNHRVYERVLASLDLHIVKALSGQKALQIAHQQDFFLILMDVQMPNMDGFETASLVLGHPKTKHIPVIFVTAFARGEVFEFKGYESGAVDYLTKPINDEILRSKVAVFLQLWEQRRTLDASYRQMEQLNQVLTETSKELQEAKDVAEAATQAKSDFLSHMSHELRSPLNSILVMSEILSNKKLEDLHQQDLGLISTINSSGQVLLSLINDILDLAKVEAGLMAIDIQSFSIRSLLEQLVTQMEPLADEKKLDLTCDIAEDLTDVLQTDPGRLGQIIRNLVGNAIKFTIQGQVSITIRAAGDTDITVVVSDTGVGIKPENLSMIFEAFRQEEGSVSQKLGGTGLGLNISLNMVRLLGGEIKISSELEKGSSFTIQIPIDLPLTESTEAPLFELHSG